MNKDDCIGGAPQAMSQPSQHTTAKRFRIGHVDLLVEADHPAFLERIAAWLADYERVDGGASDAASDSASTIRATYCVTSSEERLKPPLSERAKETHGNEVAAYYQDDESWIVAFRAGGFAVVDRNRLRLTGTVDPGVVLSSVMRFEEYMHPLHELFRQLDLYPLHAACVERSDRGLLLLGPSGRGKSTLAADLVGRGFGFLSDDRCFLRETERKSFEALAFYEPFKLYARNVAHLESLRGADALSADEADKQSFDIRAHYPGQRRLRSRIAGLIFPQWSPEATSRLEPLAPGQALLELLPLTLVCFDPVSAKEHFDVLGRLVASLPVARLCLGSDRERWSELVLEFLSRTEEC